jgi:hypothetical protein
VSSTATITDACKLAVQDKIRQTPSRIHSHNGNVGVLGLSTLDSAQKGRSPNNVQSGHTKQPLGVKDTVLLQDLGKDGNGRVDRVGDDEDHGRGGVLSGGLGEVSDDRGVGVLPRRMWMIMSMISRRVCTGKRRRNTHEKVVTAVSHAMTEHVLRNVNAHNVLSHSVHHLHSRHTGLPGDTSGDDNDLGTLEGGGEAVVEKYKHDQPSFRSTSSLQQPHDSLGLLVSLGNGRGVDVADISSDTRGSPDVVQAETGDERVGLEQERQGLTDTTSGTEDGDLSLGTGRGREGSDGSLESGSSEHFGGKFLKFAFGRQQGPDESRRWECRVFSFIIKREKGRGSHRSRGCRCRWGGGKQSSESPARPRARRPKSSVRSQKATREKAN